VKGGSFGSTDTSKPFNVCYKGMHFRHVLQCLGDVKMAFDSHSDLLVTWQ